MDALARLLFGSYLGLLVVVVGGAVIMPELFFEYPHRGISVWGNYYPAVIVYSAGLLTSIICLIGAVYILPDYPERMSVMRRLLAAIVTGLLVVLLTPEQANLVFYWAHTLAAVYLFVVAGLASIWIMLHAGKTWFDWFLFWLLVAGLILSLLSASYVRLLGFLAVGQILAFNSALLIIIRATMRWSVQEVKE